MVCVRDAGRGRVGLCPQLTEALATDTVALLVNGLRSAILRTKTSSPSSSRAYSRDRSRGQRTGSDVTRGGVQCKALQTTLPHGRTLAVSLRQVADRLALSQISVMCTNACFKPFTPTYWEAHYGWWLACWTQAQKGPGSNRSRDAVG